MAHWHDWNPWARELVYIPDLTELALCVKYGEYLRDGIPPTWLQHGEKIDAYILPPSMVSGLCESAGIRYGKEDNQYISPYFDRHRLTLLYNKYKSD